MARSVCRAARAALRGRELRGAKVQVVAWSGGRGCAREGFGGAEGACSRGVYALSVDRLCAKGQPGTVLCQRAVV